MEPFNLNRYSGNVRENEELNKTQLSLDRRDDEMRNFDQGRVRRM